MPRPRLRYYTPVVVISLEKILPSPNPPFVRSVREDPFNTSVIGEKKREKTLYTPPHTHTHTRMRYRIRSGGREWVFMMPLGLVEPREVAAAAVAAAVAVAIAAVAVVPYSHLLRR